MQLQDVDKIINGYQSISSKKILSMRQNLKCEQVLEQAQKVYDVELARVTQLQLELDQAEGKLITLCEVIRKLQNLIETQAAIKE